eukprot:TRINITY_DN30673_c0_g1_i1.p1 TRINITY_DN30673_c0_g1~~TRINITY_DN30673_c0_g1_i1.p1  ORF type:complete len:675 (+),score=167.75 TRINITY_DN30673_c0_g1_i1:84-2108(+)
MAAESSFGISEPVAALTAAVARFSVVAGARASSAAGPIMMDAPLGCRSSTGPAGALPGLTRRRSVGSQLSDAELPPQAEDPDLRGALRSLELCLADGVYDSSTWWQFLAHALPLLQPEPSGERGWLRTAELKSRRDGLRWLLRGLADGEAAPVLEEAFALFDVVAAYYTPRAVVRCPANLQRVLQQVRRLGEMGLDAAALGASVDDVFGPTQLLSQGSSRRRSTSRSGSPVSQEMSGSYLDPFPTATTAPPLERVRRGSRPGGRSPVSREGSGSAAREVRGVSHAAVQADLSSPEGTPAPTPRTEALPPLSEAAAGRERRLQLLQVRELRILGQEAEQKGRETELAAREEALERRHGAAPRADPAGVEAVRTKLVGLLAAAGDAAAAAPALGRGDAQQRLQQLPAALLAQRCTALLGVMRGELRVLRANSGEGGGFECLSSEIAEDFFGSLSSPPEHLALSPGESPPPIQGLQQHQLTGLRTDEVGEIGKQQLARQNGACSGCGATLTQTGGGVFRAKPRPCHYTGELFCRRCHGDKRHAIPARILRRWDFTPARVCNAAYAHLSEIWSRPLVHVDAVNAELYTRLPRLQQARRLRTQITLLRKALGDTLPAELVEELAPHAALLEEADVYSMQDLVAIEARPQQYAETLREVLGKLVRASELHGGPSPEHLPA